MKKFLSIILCLNILIMPVFAEYDFSDEAQAEFDRNNTIHQNKDFSRTKTKPNKENSDDRTNYTPNDTPNDTQNNTLENNFTPQPKQHTLYGSIVKVPAGTSFDITFDAGISSGSLEKNDRLTARLTNDFVYNGKTIAPAGSLVYGTTTNAKNSGYAYGSGSLEIQFDEILTPDGEMLKISTEKVYMAAKSERASKMTRDVVVGALGTMLVGAAFTALGGSSDWGRNLAIYGGLGALGGGIRGAMQHGEDVQIPDGTTVKVKLSAPLEI